VVVSVQFKRRQKKLNLALQGGGAHGAFTWGVLDRLLNDEDIEPGWLSGTSAGAVNAIAVAYGLAHEDHALARLALESIWRSVETSGVPDLLRLNPFLSGFATAASLPNLSGLISPYAFNPLRFDPLRDILERYIDFEAIRQKCPVEVLIAATDIGTGRARIFRRHEITVDVVLASACLPTLHHAVEIEGRYYWDGGFSANPDLVTVASESPVADTLLVQLNPIHGPRLPKSAREIEDRVNTITFNQPLIRDIETILLAREMKTGWFESKSSRLARLKKHRFHLIEADEHTSELGSDSKTLPDSELLTYLHGAGRSEAGRWIMRHKGDIGRATTVDLRATYISHPPEMDDDAVGVQPNPLAVDENSAVPPRAASGQ
jgi:NTE family protein